MVESQQPVVYVIGDCHVRGQLPSVMHFLADLQQRSAARLIILGDLFDYWLDIDACVRRHAPLFARLRELRQAGWQLDFIVGNRETLAGRKLAAAGRMTLHWPVIDLKLGQHHIRVIHGDRLCDARVYHLAFALIHGFWMRFCSQLLPEWFQDWVGSTVRGSSEQRHHAPGQHRPRRHHAARMIAPRRLLAAWRNSALVLAGHIHQRWHYTGPGPQRPHSLWLLGDWQPEYGSWVEIQADGTCSHVAFDYAKSHREVLAIWSSTRDAAPGPV